MLVLAVARCLSGYSALLGAWHVSYDQILTSEMKIASLAFEIMRLATWVSTRTTVGSKLGIFEFRLAWYQWGNSWSLYSFCLIGC